MIVHLFPVLLGCMHGLAYGEGDGVILDKTWPNTPREEEGSIGRLYMQADGIKNSCTIDQWPT